MEQKNFGNIAEEFESWRKEIVIKHVVISNKFKKCKP